MKNDSLTALLTDMRRAQKLLLAAGKNNEDMQLEAKVIGEYADRLQAIIGAEDDASSPKTKPNMPGVT